MKKVYTKDGNPPLGHYSQAIVHNGLVYVSTQLGRDRETGSVGPVEEQTENILDSIEAILVEAGSSISNVLRATIYLSDITNWDAVNQIYTRRFGEHRPARGVIPVGTLHGGCEVAMDVVAAVAN